MITWRVVLFEMLTVRQMIQQFTRFYETLSFVAMFTTASQPSVLVLSQMNPLHILTSYFFNICFSIILPDDRGSISGGGRGFFL
jgi:hypothetical protein